MRSASIRGWWYGKELTPVPSLMCLVRSAATPMKTSGDEMISNPAEWCSPIHASAKPSRSIATIRSRSRSMASVGFCPTGWKGAMKFPKRIGPFWPAGTRSTCGFGLVGRARRFDVVAGGKATAVTKSGQVPQVHPPSNFAADTDRVHRSTRTPSCV